MEGGREGSFACVSSKLTNLVKRIRCVFVFINYAFRRAWGSCVWTARLPGISLIRYEAEIPVHGKGWVILAGAGDVFACWRGAAIFSGSGIGIAMWRRLL